MNETGIGVREELASKFRESIRSGQRYMMASCGHFWDAGSHLNELWRRSRVDHDRAIDAEGLSAAYARRLRQLASGMTREQAVAYGTLKAAFVALPKIRKESESGNDGKAGKAGKDETDPDPDAPVEAPRTAEDDLRDELWAEREARKAAEERADAAEDRTHDASLKAHAAGDPEGHDAGVMRMLEAETKRREAVEARNRRLEWERREADRRTERDRQEVADGKDKLAAAEVSMDAVHGDLKKARAEIDEQRRKIVDHEFNLDAAMTALAARDRTISELQERVAMLEETIRGAGMEVPT